MLPALKSDRLSLADVFPSCLAAISGEMNSAQLPPVRAAVVVLVDGLGAAALKARAGHARTLVAAMGARDVIEAGFPTTTASALVTLSTGVAPGQHGVVGYLQLVGDQLVRQLDDPAPGIPASVLLAAPSAAFIAPQRYRDSAFTKATLADADFIAAATIEDRVHAAISAAQTSRGLIYVYVPELDSTSHAHGWESTQWTTRLEHIDSAIAALSAGLPKDVGMLVTADHGVVDVPESGHINYDLNPALMAGVAHIGGEPRCLQLYFDGPQPATVEAWRSSEGDRSWVATRQEAIDAGWFGGVAPHVVERIGDLLIAARKNIAYYPSTATSTMVGQHGSWSPEELRVPLLRFGAFRTS